MKGTIVNAAAILVGTGVGVFLKKGIPEKYKQTIIQAMALAVIVIGMQMALKSNNILIVVISLVLGGLTGEYLKLEQRLTNIGNRLETLFGNAGGSFSRAFVTASLVYCIGAMAIVGSIEDGLNGNPNTLYIKSLLDGVTSVVFSSTLGVGVAFSALPVFVYQGVITLMAQHLQGILTPSVIAELSATGGILIIGIGIKILELKEIRVGNLLPSIGYAILLAAFLPEALI